MNGPIRLDKIVEGLFEQTCQLSVDQSHVFRSVILRRQKLRDMQTKIMWKRNEKSIQLAGIGAQQFLHDQLWPLVSLVSH